MDILVGIANEGEGVASAIIYSLSETNHTTTKGKASSVEKIRQGHLLSLDKQKAPEQQKSESQEPEIVQELKSLIEDPEIDPETKSLLENTIRNAMELAKRAKSQPNS